MYDGDKVKEPGSVNFIYSWILQMQIINFVSIRVDPGLINLKFHCFQNI